MITWAGKEQPPLDPHRRELHHVPFYRTPKDDTAGDINAILYWSVVVLFLVLGALAGQLIVGGGK